MRLAIDASILVAELLRRRGRELIEHPELELAVAERQWAESRHELAKRIDRMVRQGRLSVATGDELLAAAFALVEARVTVVPLEVYAHLEATARARVPRDADDWQTVALALALDAGIWTGDADFLGCGVPTWTTDTLRLYLAGREGD